MKRFTISFFNGADNLPNDRRPTSDRRPTTDRRPTSLPKAAALRPFAVRGDGEPPMEVLAIGGPRGPEPTPRPRGTLEAPKRRCGATALVADEPQRSVMTDQWCEIPRDSSFAADCTHSAAEGTHPQILNCTRSCVSWAQWRSSLSHPRSCRRIHCGSRIDDLPRACCCVFPCQCWSSVVS